VIKNGYVYLTPLSTVNYFRKKKQTNKQTRKQNKTKQKNISKELHKITKG